MAAQSIVVRLALALASSFLAATAQADWQYTRWGMTVEEVIDASGGVARNEDNPSALDIHLGRVKLSAPYEGLGIPFETYFYFNERNELQAIVLEPIEMGDCLSAKHELYEHYGAWEKSIETDRFVLTYYWTDRLNGNFVSLVEGDLVKVPSGCRLIYEPIPMPGQEGGL